MSTKARPLLPAYSPAEERVQFASHALGALASFAGVPLLVSRATRYDREAQAGCAVYGASLIAMYLASAAYHGVPSSSARIKAALRALDHASIFVLIAGTFTAFALTAIRDLGGYLLLAAIWGLCLNGVWGVSRQRSRRWGPIGRSLLMGWLVALLVPQLVRALGPGGTWLLVGGGVLYTLGIPFYVWRRLPHHHGIWHVFVLLGSLSHFLAVALFALPRSG